MNIVPQYDLVIIGAGLSGIGMACHVHRQCPEMRYLILEGRERLGGTWDLFRYPGIRSDSDMFTFGYNFKPWKSPQTLADGSSILQYVREAAEEHGVLEHIRFNAQVQRIAWDSESASWTLHYRDTRTERDEQLRCSFINGCTGYYDYEKGYEPQFPGSEDFHGRIIHPQKWPEDLDYRGKRVVVIGSGATAVTIVPEMSVEAAHVTMLQRSPTYMGTIPLEDRFSILLRKCLPELWAYRASRTAQIAFAAGFYTLSRRFPNAVKRFLLRHVRSQLDPAVDMRHFTPRYNPWDERLCAVKGGDLFEAINSGKVTVVTDHIDRFTEQGILLQSGRELDADIIVTATGLELKFFGGIAVEVDGTPYIHTDKLCYRGVMLENLPNLGFTFGYTNSSWTLKADITSAWIIRVLTYMKKHRYRKVMPVRTDPRVSAKSFLDFQSGYIQRGAHLFPKTGDRIPWKLKQLYPYDLLMLRYARLRDGVLQFSCPEETTGEPVHFDGRDPIHGQKQV